MSERRAIVIAVDGLRASALGAYGNTWHGTPALDLLASQSIVLDAMWRETPDVAGFYSAAWGDGELLRQLRQRGGALTLVTDDSEIAQLADATAAADVWQVAVDNAEPAAEISDTGLARLFAAATQRLETWLSTPAAEPGLFWIHARGFHAAWDAPRELRAALLEEDDLEPPTFVAPPALEATSEHDALLAFRAAYAAQMIVLDECVGALLAAAAELEHGAELLVVLVGCRGFALGEHGVVGAASTDLYGEVLHVPCLLRVGNGAPAPPRRRELSTVVDLNATLAHWLLNEAGPKPLGIDLLADDTPNRSFVISQGSDGQRGLRAAEWYLRQPAGRDEAAELYVKPDDRWEANEVADRCHDVVEELLATLDRAAAGPDFNAISPSSTSIGAGASLPAIHD